MGLAALAALWLMPSGRAPAATITVTTVADENGSGPNCSLREAIASANGDADVGGCVGVGAYGADTIVLGATLSLPATITLTDLAGALTVSSDVTITGPGATQLAIDGNHTTRVFSITTGQVLMSALTIQHGNSNRGGGILNELGGTLTLMNCTLSDNSASGGWRHGIVWWREGGWPRGTWASKTRPGRGAGNKACQVRSSGCEKQRSGTSASSRDVGTHRPLP